MDAPKFGVAVIFGAAAIYGAAAILLRHCLRRRPCSFAVLALAQTKVPEGLNTENSTENKDCRHGLEVWQYAEDDDGHSQNL